jgi:hypothetical protein
MSTVIQGGSSTAGKANVNADFELEVALTKVEEKAGYATMVAENDDGTVTGSRYTLTPEVTGDFRLRVGTDQMSFNELFPGAALNSALWTAPVTTATLTVAGGFANLNAAGSLAINAVARLTTYRSFPCYKSYTTYFEMEANFTSLPVAGNVCEWGAIIHTGTAVPTDGAFFRVNSSGEFRAVINNNGTEIQSGTLDFATLVNINHTRAFLIYIMSNKAFFWIDNQLVAVLDAPAATGTVTSSQNLPLSFRNYNFTAVSTAQIMKVSMVNVTLADMNTSKPWNDIIAGAGGNSAQGQTGGTMGSTALYTNNLAPTAGVAMTNTTAALGVGLGGQFSALPTLAVNTDGIICSFQVPLGTAALPGKSLYIKGVNIDSVVTTVLAGNATPVVYAYSLAFGHTAVSLATTETATSKAPRRKVLGLNSFAAAAAAGTIGNEVKTNLENPIVVYPGEFVQVVAKNIGAITTTGVVTFFIDIDGYFE